MSRDRLMEARKLIEAKRYEEGAAILRTLPNDPTAQKWLAQLEQYRVTAPKPQSLPLPQSIQPPGMISQPPSDYRQQLVLIAIETERVVAQLERELAQIDQNLAELKKGQNMIPIFAFLGLLLMPIGLGFILLIAATVAAIGNPRKQKELIAQRDFTLFHLDQQQRELTRLRYELRY